MEEKLKAILALTNKILERCSNDVEKQLQMDISELMNRWDTVSDIIVNLEINVYKIIQLWAAYERRYVEVQAFIDNLSSSIQKEPLECSGGDTTLLPKYKVPTHNCTPCICVPASKLYVCTATHIN